MAHDRDLIMLPGSAGEHDLQRRYGNVERAERFYGQQVLDRLNVRMREFVARQEMLFVSTSDGQGECDCTFRARPPGFVRVLGDRRIAWPEYRGNGVHASLGTIVENAHVGLLFVDFLRDVIGMHVNGRATIVENAEMQRCSTIPRPIRYRDGARSARRSSTCTRRMATVTSTFRGC